MTDVCAQCGDTKPLTEDGVCRHRHGCEHRVRQHEMRMARLNEELELAEARRRHPSAADFFDHVFGAWIVLPDPPDDLDIDGRE